MKKIWLQGLSFILLASLFACETEEQGNEQSEGAAEGEEWYEELNFETLDLNAEYEDGEYEVEYDYNDGEPEAEIEDTRGDKQEIKEGDEALDELEEMLPEIELTNESSDEEITAEVVNAFELDEVYEELKVRIKFFEKELEVED
ncbi:YusW family protein [Salipaludibacillus daqingensis]|uniref:YusW family protein n=1 Tax=Salipaludibacillus daqingensis TaxID=3041001 RepID=UPI00247468C1|nr:YusW family protein [Salipaludibacillus daqingensis]